MMQRKSKVQLTTIIFDDKLSRDLLGNGGAGGEASCRGFGVSPNFLFPKLLGDYALDEA